MIRSSRVLRRTPVTTKELSADGSVIDGIHFPSKTEAKRYEELLWLEKAGHISGLARQVTFRFQHNGIKIATWRIDFTYSKDGKQFAEDAGPVDREKQMKINMMRAFYPEWQMRHD